MPPTPTGSRSPSCGPPATSDSGDEGAAVRVEGPPPHASGAIAGDEPEVAERAPARSALGAERLADAGGHLRQAVERGLALGASLGEDLVHGEAGVHDIAHL